MRCVRHGGSCAFQFPECAVVLLSGELRLYENKAGLGVIEFTRDGGPIETHVVPAAWWPFVRSVLAGDGEPGGGLLSRALVRRARRG